MIWGVIADIHGNLEALQVALEHLLHRERVEGLIFLGDAVGYGPDPEGVVEILDGLSRRMPFVGVLGNHDEAVLFPEKARFFNPVAREAIRWTREQLSERSFAFLENLPYRVELEGGLVVAHSTPEDPELWIYLTQVEQARAYFDGTDFSLALFGHTHLPTVFVADDRGGVWEWKARGALHLSSSRRYLVNPGSVGQPRDGDPRAAWGILNLDRREFRFFRQEYPVDIVAGKILRAGLPLFLAERLYEGF